MFKNRRFPRLRIGGGSGSTRDSSSSSSLSFTASQREHLGKQQQQQKLSSSTDNPWDNRGGGDDINALDFQQQPQQDPRPSRTKNSGTDATSLHSAEISVPSASRSGIFGDSIPQNVSGATPGVGDLSNFDACVEACDALAAASSSTVSGGGAGGSGSAAAGAGAASAAGAQSAPAVRKDGNPDEKSPRDTIEDCSVMVSPDGALLFLPQEGGSQGSGTGGRNLFNSLQGANGKSLLISGDSENTVTTAARADDASPTKILTAVQSFFPGEEYESAVVVGTDVLPGGDRTANGFSCSGYSDEATARAIRRSEHTLRTTGTFVEDLILNGKENAARTCGVCDKWRNDLVAAASITAAGEDGPSGAVGNTAGGRGGFYYSGFSFLTSSSSPGPSTQNRKKPSSIFHSIGNTDASSSSSTAAAAAVTSRGTTTTTATTTTATTTTEDVSQSKPSRRTSRLRGMKRHQSAESAQSTADSSMVSVDLESTHSGISAASDDVDRNSSRSNSIISVEEEEQEQERQDGEGGDDGSDKKVRVNTQCGPMLHHGTTLHTAVVALEQYHTAMAENDANRWRMASASSPVYGQTGVVGGGGGGGMTTTTTATDNEIAGILPAVQTAAEKTSERAAKRENTLREVRRGVHLAEGRLRRLKEEAVRRWEDVRNAELEVTRVVEERMLERSRERERRRLEQVREEAERLAAEKSASGKKGEGDNDGLGVTDQEIWDLVSKVAESMEDGSFAPTGLPMAPRDRPRDRAFLGVDSGDTDGGDSDGGDGGAGGAGGTNRNGSRSSSRGSSRAPSPPPLPMVSRTEIEEECGLPRLRALAMATDDVVEDAAGALLNALSTLDTTRRSARIAAEASLLSACNSQAQCLRSLVRLERAALEERLRHLIELERIVEKIDVRKDLDVYITADKKEPGNSTRLGDDDDGGVASALAVLNSHSEGVGHGVGVAGMAGTSVLEGWGNSSDEFDEESVYGPEEIEDAVEYLFAPNPLLSDGVIKAETDDNIGDDARRKEIMGDLESTISFLSDAVKEKSVRARRRRSSVCLALNHQRSVRTELGGRLQFEGLCRVFDALLSGCDRETGDVANAKMCMMLAQTFYMVNPEIETENEGEGKMYDHETKCRTNRKKRIFVKTKLIGHPLWSDEDFWDQALFQCVSESLTHSGVMSNFDRPALRGDRSEWTEIKKLKWHDLTPDERDMAASQVLAVVFAQLGALAHSMVEFGCGIERACAFVRRLSIRHQLPISQRAMLLQHLLAGESSMTEVAQAHNEAELDVPDGEADTKEAGEESKIEQREESAEPQIGLTEVPL